MSEFKREARYIVIKTSDLAKVPTAYRSDLVDPLSRLQAHLPNRDFVVVESDWPEYEPVWQMIEARMNGEPNALNAALAREAALQTSLDAVTFNLDKTDKALLALQNSEAALREELVKLKEVYIASTGREVKIKRRLTEAEKLLGDWYAANAAGGILVADEDYHLVTATAEMLEQASQKEGEGS